MKTNQLRLWFSSLAYVSIEAPQRLGLVHPEVATARPQQFRLKLLKIGARVSVSVRRIKIAIASACPFQSEFALARPRAAPARSRGASVPASRALKANARPLRLVMRENKDASPPWREQQRRWRRHASPLSRGRNKTRLQSRPTAASAEKCGLNRAAMDTVILTNPFEVSAREEETLRFWE